MKKQRTGSSSKGMVTRASSATKSESKGNMKNYGPFENAKEQEKCKEKCKLCSMFYVEDYTKMLECNRCHGRFCIQCLDIEESKYEVLSNSLGMMWFCGPCQVVVEKSILTDRKIEERCREIMAPYEIRIEELERLLSLKCGEVEIRSIVKEELALHSVSTALPTQNTEEITEELNERKRRENNIIVLGVPEQQHENARERKKLDTKQAKEIIGACCDCPDEVFEKVIRIGKRPEEGEIRSRPIMISVDDMENKRKIFRSKRKLKDHPDFSRIQIRNDLTVVQRTREKELRAVAIKKESEETEGFVYRVRGPPWKRRVVKLQSGIRQINAYFK